MAIERRLNLALERVNKWTHLNKLTLSIDKCKYMITGSKKMFRNPSIKIRNENIKYLGLLIDEGLTFHEHAKFITDKAKNVFHSLNRSMSRLYQIEGKALRTICHAAIVPMVAYEAEIFEDR